MVEFHITARDFEATTAEVHENIKPTPQHRWPLLSERTGAEVWVKHENHTPTGSFKIRGGAIYLAEVLRKSPNIKGVIAATLGNHGQSVACAATRRGLRSVVVVPYGNSIEKNNAMRAQGAEIITHGDDFQEALEYANVMASKCFGLTYARRIPCQNFMRYLKT